MSTVTPPASQPQANNSNTTGLSIYARGFRKSWQAASADNDLTLYGFRRFKTSHLLNLRFLEDEIAELDHDVFQAGLTLGLDHAPANKLGLNYCKRDAYTPDIGVIITGELVLRLRGLLRQYGTYHIYLNIIEGGKLNSILDELR